MNDTLKNIINKVKERLESNPDSILTGQIRKGNPNPNVENSSEISVEYIEFLQECDGASFGEIDLFPSSELSKNQFYVETLKGGKETWLFVGLILYEPIVINKTNGDVYRFYRDIPTNMPQECFGSFNNFLMEYAFGKKYMDIAAVDRDNDWTILLAELGLL
ncbi:hypothetical protein SAMN04487969_110103 [Paenibacillus algorifonticola]|uniref:SMI1/KNR4 family protein n=1 Tax=Paenibacillus algorifonticola TaxID=684063 RepID=A0A1I2EWK9_9BACL|nr:hypothetical protein [Paenibacillus algorifonticola]SFE97245.1 hypothetical protein SAMN04487969_110103 [Paenibacillus algorifonticola]